MREAFVRLYEKGLVYRGHRVIHWCPRCETSLSDEEAEFHDTNGALYHIAYPLADDASVAVGQHAAGQRGEQPDDGSHGRDDAGLCRVARDDEREQRDGEVEESGCQSLPGVGGEPQQVRSLAPESRRGCHGDHASPAGLIAQVELRN